MVLPDDHMAHVVLDGSPIQRSQRAMEPPVVQVEGSAYPFRRDGYDKLLFLRG